MGGGISEEVRRGCFAKDLPAGNPTIQKVTEAEGNAACVIVIPKALGLTIIDVVQEHLVERDIGSQEGRMVALGLDEAVNEFGVVGGLQRLDEASGGRAVSLKV